MQKHRKAASTAERTLTRGPKNAFHRCRAGCRDARLLPVSSAERDAERKRKKNPRDTLIVDVSQDGEEGGGGGRGGGLPAGVQGQITVHNLEAGDEAAARGILQGGGGHCILGVSLSSSPSFSFSLAV